mgnify:CR=1 FL=1
MNIGPLHLENPVILAPLAGITNLPFRLLAKEAGCGLVTSEMVSADGLVHGAPNALALLRSLPAEKPLAVQLFGSDPAVMAEAAAIVEDSGADLLDINCGCAGCLCGIRQALHRPNALQGRCRNRHLWRGWRRNITMRRFSNRRQRGVFRWH